MEDALSLSLAAAAERIRAKELSPVELTEAALARIEAPEPVLNAYALSPPSRRWPTRASRARDRRRRAIAARCTASRSGSRTSATWRACRPRGSSEVLPDHVAEADRDRGRSASRRPAR